MSKTRRHDSSASLDEDVPGRRLNQALVRSLHTLLSEASVSRAASRIGVAQPATSRHLKVLRELIDDALLVRMGNRMMLTKRAESLLIASAPHSGGLFDARWGSK